MAKAFDKMRRLRRRGFDGLYILSRLRNTNPDELAFRRANGETATASSNTMAGG